MKLHRHIIPAALILMSLFCFTVQAQEDVAGSSDHPLFPNRMPGYSIGVYQQLAFSSHELKMRPPRTIEGKFTRIHYYLKDPKSHPGGLAIRRNYENAIKAAGGEVVYSDDSYSILRATRNGVEVWAELQASLAYAGRYYFLRIIEREPMQQVIKADAMAASIAKDGFVALDIHFATGKSEILPESRPIVDEIVVMLKKQPNLTVSIEGHTDNVGTAAANKTLSEARARSVLNAVVAAGVSANRLSSAGFGQDKPSADNRTDEGRAKNRRVEIVRK